MKTRAHNCRDHVVMRVTPTSKTFASGGPISYHCSVCKQPVRVALKSTEVLARIPA